MLKYFGKASKPGRHPKRKTQLPTHYFIRPQIKWALSLSIDRSQTVLLVVNNLICKINNIIYSTL